MHDYRDFHHYDTWVHACDTTSDEDRALIRNDIAQLAERPAFSIVLSPPVGEGDWAARLIESLVAQLYPHWQAWIPRRALPNGASDPRLHVIPDEADWLGAGLDAAAGRLVLPLPADAVLSERALYQLAVAFNQDSQALIFFGDEDQLDAAGRRCRPRLKTAWDPDLILGRNAIGTPVAYDRAYLAAVHAACDDRAGLTEYDLALRATAGAPPNRIRHISAILCHRRLDPDAPPVWDPQRARDIVRRHLDAIGDAAEVAPAPLAPQWNRIIRPLPEPAPLVSILMPTRDRADLLARAADAVLARTDYPALELLIIDNGGSEPEALALLRRLGDDPRVRILAAPGPFNFAAMNNAAAQVARGELLVLLNNDIDAPDRGWLREMVSHAVRPDVGIVGARLLYDDGRVQHAGVVFDQDGEVIHQLRLSGATDPGPDGELALTRTVSAVTGACLCLRRSVFFEIGQLDERNLAVNFNDIDLCLRAGDFGYRVVVTPFAGLIHYESASRDPGAAAAQDAYRRERRWFQAEWGDLLANDPFRNPNLVYGWTETRMASRRPAWATWADGA